MSFDFSRLRRSDRIIGGAAIALFIFLFFFDWYGVSANLGPVQVSGGGTGWQAFTNSRWIWLITIIAALVSVAVAGGALKLRSPVQLSVLVAGLGALSTLLILYRILKHPTIDVPGAHAGIKIGIWLGLIASAALAYGGYHAMQDEGTSLSDVREQASAAVAGMSSHPDSAPRAPATPVTAVAPSAPHVAPPAPPAAPLQEPGPAPPAPPAAPAGPSQPPIPPPAAPPEQT